jgi:hypothetical protein
VKLRVRVDERLVGRSVRSESKVSRRVRVKILSSGTGLTLYSLLSQGQA